MSWVISDVRAMQCSVAQNAKRVFDRRLPSAKCQNAKCQHQQSPSCLSQRTYWQAGGNCNAQSVGFCTNQPMGGIKFAFCASAGKLDGGRFFCAVCGRVHVRRNGACARGSGDSAAASAHDVGKVGALPRRLRAACEVD